MTASQIVLVGQIPSSGRYRQYDFEKLNEST